MKSYTTPLVGDDNYIKWLSAYIHQNPTVARLVKQPEKYPYSSYGEYVGVSGRGLCEKSTVLEQFKNLADYKQFASTSLE